VGLRKLAGLEFPDGVVGQGGEGGEHPGFVFAGTFSRRIRVGTGTCLELRRRTFVGLGGGVFPGWGRGVFFRLGAGKFTAGPL
jgi:hypothetical protein